MVYVAYGALGKLAVTVFQREKVSFVISVMSAFSFISLAVIILFDAFTSA